MKYRVVPSLWRPAGGHIFQQGDVVEEEVLARIGPVSSWRRLGLIEPIDDRPSVAPKPEAASWWKGLTKKQLLEQGPAHGHPDLDANATKKAILDEIKGGS